MANLVAPIDDEMHLMHYAGLAVVLVAVLVMMAWIWNADMLPSMATGFFALAHSPLLSP